MLRKLLNQAHVTAILEPAEPLLIASGVPNTVGIDLPFVRTYREDSGKEQPYLPGSSLKGVLRSHAERVSRALAGQGQICDPHVDEPSSRRLGRVPFCGDRLGRLNRDRARPNPLKSHELYRQSCPICRTFGSTVYRGRLAIGDANLVEGSSASLERRDGVGIDRFSGGAASGVKFEMEVLARGRFECRMRLENFEVWQLGMLAMLCQDLMDGMLSVGHATTRGLGRLQATLEGLEVSYIGRAAGQVPPGEVWGVGKLLTDDTERACYGYRAQDSLSLEQPVSIKLAGIRRIQRFEKTPLAALFEAIIPRWAETIQAWPEEVSHD